MGNVDVMGAGLGHVARECADPISDVNGSGHGKTRGLFSRFVNMSHED